MASCVRCPPPGKSPWEDRQNGSARTSRLRLSRTDIAQQAGHLDLAAAARTSNGLRPSGNKAVGFARPMGQRFRAFCPAQSRLTVPRLTPIREAIFRCDSPPGVQQPANFVNHSCRINRQILPKNRHTLVRAPFPARRRGRKPPRNLR